MTKPKAALATLGWRVDTAARLTQAVKDFQRSWNLGPALKIDGSAKAQTLEALELSLERKAKGLGDLSEHFSAWEFKCQCGGRWADCRRIWPLRSLVQAAEAYRGVIGPFTPDRACRCKRQNAAVSGAKNSQHLYGAALDVPAVLPPNRLRDLRKVSGLGIYKTLSHDVVRHFDVRHASGSGVAGTTTHPAAWDYGKLKDRNGRVIAAPPIPKPPSKSVKPKNKGVKQQQQTRSWFEMATAEDLRAIVRQEIAAAKIPSSTWAFKDEEGRDAYQILRDVESAFAKKETWRGILTGMSFFKDPLLPGRGDGPDEGYETRIPLGRLMETAAGAALDAADGANPKAGPQDRRLDRRRRIARRHVNAGTSPLLPAPVATAASRRTRRSTPES